MSELEFLKKLHDDLLRHAEKFSFDKKHPWHRNLVALHGSLIELGGSLLIMLNEGGKAGIPSIFRTIMETYIEFHNLLLDKTYGYYMEAQYNEQWLKLLKEAAKGTNPYLISITKNPDLPQQIEQFEKTLAELKSKGYSPLNVRARFEKAGMLNEYLSIYNMLSTDSHGNIRALISRHIEIKGADLNLIYYKDAPIGDFLSYIAFTCLLLIRSAIGIHEVLHSEVLSEVKSLQKDFDEWQETYLNNELSSIEEESS